MIYSWLKKVNFSLDLGFLVKKKNKGVGWLETENKLKKNKKNNNRNLLEVSGYMA